MSDVTPARVGLLIDYVDDDGGFDENILPSLQLVVDEYVERGVLERPVEFVVRAVQGLPKGSFRAVRDAFYELVEQDSLVIFGPWVSENGAALRPYVEELAEVACITMAATETMLGEWVFGLPAGSMEEEPIIMATWRPSTAAAPSASRSKTPSSEPSTFAPQESPAPMRGCVSPRRCPSRRCNPKSKRRWRLSPPTSPTPSCTSGSASASSASTPHCGRSAGCHPGTPPPPSNSPSTSPWWREQLAGWIGLDQYDERNVTGRDFLDRFEARYGRRPEYFFPVYCYDVGRLMMTALANARPLTGAGVKQALEKIKMLPAASGAPGTRLRFGRYIRHGWVGSEFLVARRVLPDASGIVLHGTIEGLLEPPALS